MAAINIPKGTVFTLKIELLEEGEIEEAKGYIFTAMFGAILSYEVSPTSAKEFDDCVDLYVHYSSWDSKKENQVMRQLFSDGGSYMMYPESGELWVAQKYDPNVQQYWSLMSRP